MHGDEPDYRYDMAMWPLSLLGNRRNNGDYTSFDDFDADYSKWPTRAFLTVASLAIATYANAQWTKVYEWAGAPLQTGIVASGMSSDACGFTGSTPWAVCTQDDGVTWRESGMPLARGAISTVAFDPLDPNTLYVHADDGATDAVFKSVDNGRSFADFLRGMFRGGTYIAIDPRTPTTVYVSRAAASCLATCLTPGGIMKTTDGGVTWQETARVWSTTRALVIDPLDRSTVYAAGHDIPLSRATGGLYRTRDAGTTWPIMYEGDTSISYLAVDRLSRVYAIIGARFETPLLRSSNYGATWHRLQVNVGPGPQPTDSAWPYITGVANDPRRTETMYVSTLTHGILFSYNDGNTWLPLGDIPDTVAYGIAVTPNGSVLAATHTGIYRYVMRVAFPPSRHRAVSP